MISFIERRKKHDIAEEALLEYMESNGIETARSGYESLKQSGNFKKVIKALVDDETAKRIRYFPDFVLAKKQAWLIDVKSSKATIEKDAYDVYMDLSCIGYNVGLVFAEITKDEQKDEETVESLKFTEIENLIIQNKKESDFPKKYIIPPIIDGKWLAPRKLKEIDEKKYWLWKEKTGGSGTTYGYIDFESTKFVILKNTSGNADTLPDAVVEPELGQQRLAV